MVAGLRRGQQCMCARPGGVGLPFRLTPKQPAASPGPPRSPVNLMGARRPVATQRVAANPSSASPATENHSGSVCKDVNGSGLPNRSLSVPGWSAQQPAHPPPARTYDGPAERLLQATCARSDRGSWRASRRSGRRRAAPPTRPAIPALSRQRICSPLSDRPVRAVLLPGSCSPHLGRDFPDASSQLPKTVAQSSIDRKRGHSSRIGGLGMGFRYSRPGASRAHVPVAEVSGGDITG